MNLTVIDHTEPEWQLAYQKQGKENGAATYSREIVDIHVPMWNKYLSEFEGEAVIGTCRPMTHRRESGDLAIQYLHTYRYGQPLAQPLDVYRSLRRRFNKVVLVTAYKGLYKQLQHEDIPVLHLPMSIDASKLAHITPPKRRKEGIIYFGNITPPKQATFESFKKACHDAGMKLEVISDSKYRRHTITQEEAWEIVSEYKYGAGVGRCALEMMALGLKVFIVGARFGGIMTDEAEYQAQSDTNFNGRIVTFNREMRACIDSRELMMEPKTNDSSGEFRKELQKIIRNYVTMAL